MISVPSRSARRIAIAVYLRGRPGEYHNRIFHMKEPASFGKNSRIEFIQARSIQQMLMFGLIL